eukprot:scaffold89375_cov66-Phaeocystis_antarctica.AAC.1
MDVTPTSAQIEFIMSVCSPSARQPTNLGGYSVPPLSSTYGPGPVPSPTIQSSSTPQFTSLAYSPEVKSPLTFRQGSGGDGGGAGGAGGEGGEGGGKGGEGGDGKGKHQRTQSAAPAEGKPKFAQLLTSSTSLHRSQKPESP